MIHILVHIHKTNLGKVFGKHRMNWKQIQFRENREFYNETHSAVTNKLSYQTKYALKRAGFCGWDCGLLFFLLTALANHSRARFLNWVWFIEWILVYSWLDESFSRSRKLSLRKVTPSNDSTTYSKHVHSI